MSRQMLPSMENGYFGFQIVLPVYLPYSIAFKYMFNFTFETSFKILKEGRARETDGCKTILSTVGVGYYGTEDYGTVGRGTR